MFHFKNLESTFLFLPLILVFSYLLILGKNKLAKLVIPTDLNSDKKENPLNKFFLIEKSLIFIALSLMIIALMRPQSLKTKTKRIAEAIDIVICFDLSKSMEAIDFEPNRRTVAIRTISNFIDKRPDDRMGLVLFSGEAYMATPLTTDHALLKKSIQKSNNDFIEDGTAIGQALAVASKHLKDSNTKSKVIILVTDGDNNMGSVDPMTAAEIAAGYNLKVYTIGIGKKGRVAFPVKFTDPFGNTQKRMQYLSNASNDDLLKKIAKKTTGQFFSAQQANTLDRVFSQINKLEKTKIEIRKSTKSKELSWPLLVLASLLLFLWSVLTNTIWRRYP